MSRSPFRIVALAALASSAYAAEIDFNRQIRPILSDKCYTCHGPDVANRKTKLRFDLEDSAKAALANGKFAIVAGHPEQSEVIARVTSPNKALRMPPAYMGKDALSPKEIELLREWVAQGAKWMSFWSFNPPVKAPVPVGQNAIDFFIGRRLRQEGLSRSPEADRGTLIRRVSLDLIGLPPTVAEVKAFVEDHSPNAYEKVVDRLLASPRYAERMAYRWMEAARYGDTNGYQTDGPRDMYRWRDWVIEAYRKNMPYDRFVAEQIAGDLMPHATRDQIIATGFNRNHRTTGEGGIIPEEYRVEYVADRVQTTSTVFLGLTVGCARCHDHKYDPISQKDFYRMFAYFNRVPDEKGFVWNYGNEDPLIKAPTPDQEQRLAELDRELTGVQHKWMSRQPEIAKAASTWKPGERDWSVTKGLVFSDAQERKFEGTAPFEQKDGKAVDFGYLQPFTYSVWIKPESLNGGVFSHSDDYFEGSGHGLYLMDGKVRFHLIYRWTDLGIRKETNAKVRAGEWQQITVTYDGRRKAAGLRIYIDGVLQTDTNTLFDQNNEPLHVPDRPIRIGAAGGMKYKGSIRDARIYNLALRPEEVEAISAPGTLSSIAALPPASRSPLQARKLELAYLDLGATDVLRDVRNAYQGAVERRQQFYDSIPSVMVMRDGSPRESFLLKRGAYDAPGEKVTAGIPGIFGKPDAALPDNRLGLAKWMTDRQNPLTARVAVNRLWQSLFGYGIVKTVDDFGSQGEWPVHPELLDWLAVEFMDSDWDVKHVLKTIVLSETYRQSSRTTPELLQKDPENRLLARGPRFRLGPEVIRDQALAASGLLVEKLGGPSVKPYQPAGLWQELAGGKGYVQDKGEGLYRRSLYTYWKRTAAPPYMINFDSPNREVCTVWENRTNSPLQALNLMNDVTFLEASRKLAERLLTEGGRTAPERIDYGFRLLLARPADVDRAAILSKALDKFEAGFRARPEAAEQLLKQGESPVRQNLSPVELAAWTDLSSILLNMDEVINKQ